MIAEAIMPRVTLGSTRWSRSPPPVAGNQPRCRENAKISRSPSQKLGIDTPRSATTIERHVEPRVAPERRHEAERDAERDRHHHAGQRELGRAADVLADLGGHGPAAPDRGAEVAAERVADEAAVLQEDRLVEMELRPHLGDLVRRGDELGEHHLHRVAGDQEQHAEHGEGDPEQHGHHGEDAPGEVRQHAGAALTRLTGGS